MWHSILHFPAKTALLKSTSILLLAISFTLLLATFLLPSATLAAGPQITTDVTPTPDQSVTEPTLSLDTALSTLYQGQAGQIVLTITNASNLPVCIKDVVAKGPDFIILMPESLNDAAALSPCSDQVVNGPTLPPKLASNGIKGFKEIVAPENFIITAGQKSTIAVQVSTTDSVQTGMQLLAFEVGFQWKNATTIQSGNLATTKSLDAEVLQGNDAVLKALSIPSFLFLPGFLAVVVWRILLQIFGLNPDENKFSFLQPTKAESWPLAVLLSIGLDFVYFRVTGHGFFSQYGLGDIAIIWCISIALALILFSLFQLAVWLVYLYNTWQKARIAFSSTDGPLDILSRLENQNMGLLCTYVSVQFDGLGQKRAFLIEKYNDNDDGTKPYWFSPPIIVTWNEKSNPQLETLLNQKILQGSPGEVAQLLTAEQDKAWKVTLGKPGVISNAPKKNIALDSLAAKQYIVQQEF